MGSQERQAHTSLKDRLFREFYRFSFFRAVDILENLSPGRKPFGKTLAPGEEAVRFSSKPGLSFPPSDISKIENKDSEKPVDMEVTFMGLVGPSGVLPHCYNEQVIERILEKDYGLKSFYDIFHHRLISLFYMAWKKYRLAENYLPGAKDKNSSCILSLTGLGTPGLLESIGLPDKSLAYYCSGLLSRGVPSACAVEAAVGYLTDVPVDIHQFIEQLLPLSPGDRTRIGTANARLGTDAVCGGYIKDCLSKFRVNLGPMEYGRYIRFLPGGEMLRSVFALVKYMAGIEYEFEVRVILRRDEVPSCILGEGHPLLGETTWIGDARLARESDPYATFQETDL